MSVALLGVNHRTASIELREKLGRAASYDGHRLEILRADHAAEIALISTCNRLEIYSVPTGPVAALEDAILRRLASVSEIPRAQLDRVVYRKRDREAVEHLLRVACGLDSQVLGETQVLGQISQCFETARVEEAVGPLLTTLLARAVHAGRRARSETDISLGKTSVSHVAAAFVDAQLGGLSGKSVIVVGAGQTAARALEALYSRGDPHVVCLNRSTAKAEAMAEPTGSQVLPWPSLARALAGCDAAITATSAPHPILYPEDLKPVLEERTGKPLILVDIAVPRDIDPAVRELPGVVLYDIDQLETSLDEGRAGREVAVPFVERIVLEETDTIMEWLQSRDVAPLVREMRERARAIADQEAQRAIRKLDGLDERQRQIVAKMARQIANKIVHEPTVRLKAKGQDSYPDTVAGLVAEIFGLGAREAEEG